MWYYSYTPHVSIRYVVIISKGHFLSACDMLLRGLWRLVL